MKWFQNFIQDFWDSLTLCMFFCVVTTGLSMFIHTDTLVLVSEFVHIMVVQYFLSEWCLVLTNVGTFQSFILLQHAYSYDEAYYNLPIVFTHNNGTNFIKFVAFWDSVKAMNTLQLANLICKIN